MVQGINKEYIFKNKKYIETYLELLRKYIKDYNVTIIAYCIMNNHAHFITYTNKIEDLGNYMHKVNLVYSQFYNKNNNRCGVVFRNRYKSEPIHNLQYLINCIKYIHLNPVKAKMVKKCEDYPYSSYNAYIHNGKITKSDIMLKTFGKDYNYLEIFDNTVNFMFMDIEKPNQEELREYLDMSINDYMKRNNIKLENILSDKKEFCNLIKELNLFYDYKFIDIGKKLNISSYKMKQLRRNM